MQVRDIRSHGNVFYENDTPVVGLRKNLWGGDPASRDKLEPKGLVEQLKLLPKNSSSPDSYTIVVNELGNGVEWIMQTIDLLHDAGDFEIVLPEVLIQKMRTNTMNQNQCVLQPVRGANKLKLAEVLVPR